MLFDQSERSISPSSVLTVRFSPTTPLARRPDNGHSSNRSGRQRKPVPSSVTTSTTASRARGRTVAIRRACLARDTCAPVRSRTKLVPADAVICRGTTGAALHLLGVWLWRAIGNDLAPINRLRLAFAVKTTSRTFRQCRPMLHRATLQKWVWPSTGCSIASAPASVRSVSLPVTARTSCATHWLASAPEWVAYHDQRLGASSSYPFLTVRASASHFDRPIAGARHSPTRRATRFAVGPVDVGINHRTLCACRAAPNRWKLRVKSSSTALTRRYWSKVTRDCWRRCSTICSTTPFATHYPHRVRRWPLT